MGCAASSRNGNNAAGSSAGTTGTNNTSGSNAASSPSDSKLIDKQNAIVYDSVAHHHHHRHATRRRSSSIASMEDHRPTHITDCWCFGMTFRCCCRHCRRLRARSDDSNTGNNNNNNSLNNNNNNNITDGFVKRKSVQSNPNYLCTKDNRRFSASLAGLHSILLDPESTGGVSESDTLCGALIEAGDDRTPSRNAVATMTSTNNNNKRGSLAHLSCSSQCSLCDKQNHQQQQQHQTTGAITSTTTATTTQPSTLLLSSNESESTAKGCGGGGGAVHHHHSSSQQHSDQVDSSPDDVNHNLGSSRTSANHESSSQHERCIDCDLHADQRQYCCRKHQHRQLHRESSNQSRSESVHSSPPRSCGNHPHHSHHHHPHHQHHHHHHQPTSPLTTNLSKSVSINFTPNSMERFSWENAHSSNLSNLIKFGHMTVEYKTIQALLVFKKSDAQANTLRTAGEQLGFVVTIVDTAELALNVFTEIKPELVIVDARHFEPTIVDNAMNKTRDLASCKTNNLNTGAEESPPLVDPIELARSIRNIKGSEHTCLVSLIKRSLLEQNASGLAQLLRLGYSRCMPETCRLNLCLGELLQLRECEINLHQQLKAASILLTALDACKDGVIITGPKHDIQYANNSIERMFGFRLQDMMGRNAQDYFQCDAGKAERINNFNEGKEWEGQLQQRRKSGDSVPIWNRIIPVNYQNGTPEYIIYVKEFPSLCIEKLGSPETDPSIHYGSLKGFRKTSFDLKSDVRRPSLAKFNSVSLIEAPITRVINYLIAIKESGPNFLAATLDKAIDTLKNSEIFVPQLQNLKSDDQLTSDLVSSLISTTSAQSTAASRRMSHEAASNKSSISYVIPCTATLPQASQSQHNHPLLTHHPSLSSAPSNIQSLLENDLAWNFNVIELERITSKRPLVWLGLSILNRFNVCQTLECSESTMRNWLTLIEQNYRENPYHNSTHAADVMQATACFLMSKKVKTYLDPLDEAICLLAAIIHDVDHPGRNTAFLCNSDHQLAILYNDISVLESHHAAHGFKLTLANDSANIFKSLDKETYRDVRRSMIDMVLATEMTKHFEHLNKFIHSCQVLVQQDTTEEFTNDFIIMIKRMLIKCADVSNPGRPTKLCEAWAERIAVEYCDQTDEEKQRGIPLVMPAFDRATCSIPKSQLGFMDFFVKDLFNTWDTFGDFPEMTNHMNVNYQYWQEQQKLIECKRKRSSFDSIKLKESDEDSVFQSAAEQTDKHSEVTSTSTQ